MQDFAQLSVGNLGHLSNDRSSTSESCSCVYIMCSLDALFVAPCSKLIDG